MGIGYEWVIFIHVVSAIGSIGPSFVMLVILQLLKHHQTTLDTSTALRIFRESVRFIKHAGHVLVASGIVLVAWGPWEWRQSWIVLTIFLMVVSIFFLASAFKRVVRAVEAHSISYEVMVFQLGRATWIYLILLGIMLAFMVLKPMLW